MIGNVPTFSKVSDQIIWLIENMFPNFVSCSAQS